MNMGLTGPRPMPPTIDIGAALSRLGQIRGGGLMPMGRMDGPRITPPTLRPGMSPPLMQTNAAPMMAAAAGDGGGGDGGGGIPVEPPILPGNTGGGPVSPWGPQSVPIPPGWGGGGGVPASGDGGNPYGTGNPPGPLPPWGDPNGGYWENVPYDPSNPSNNPNPANIGQVGAGVLPPPPSQVPIQYIGNPGSNYYNALMSNPVAAANARARLIAGGDLQIDSSGIGVLGRGLPSGGLTGDANAPGAYNASAGFWNPSLGGPQPAWVARQIAKGVQPTNGNYWQKGKATSPLFGYQTRGHAIVDPAAGAHIGSVMAGGSHNNSVLPKGF